jgi:hypothetical protein
LESAQGETFGKFEVQGILGQGAMGKVYMARDPFLERLVAIKTISPALISSPEALNRFKREARAAARLQHPNIVTIYELGEHEGSLYIVMEYVEGMELGEAMVPHDRFTVEQKVRMMVDLCGGLDFAHRMGFVHRDVKPANVRLTKSGVVKILDFGIVRESDSNLTQTGMVLGTPSYLSPELLQGAKVDPRADMWAVGVILYEMLAGRRPFESKTTASLLHKIMHDPPPPFDTAALGVPPALVAVASRALEKDPARRFADLGEMARALLSAIGATPLPDTPLDPAVRKRGYERNFAEARRLLAEEDLAGALEAARRAKALDPTRTGIVALIRVIEERLQTAETVQQPPPRPASPDAAAPTSRRAPATTASSPAALGPLDSAMLRAQGAAAMRDLGAFGEPPPTKEVALSPVADVLAMAGTDGAIRLWDLRTRTRTAVLRTELHLRSGHDAAALCLGFSPDGSLLASGHVDGAVHLWDMARGEALPAKLRHEAPAAALGFSPDGATLATGSLDSNLRLWDVGAAVAGEARRVLVRQPSGVTALTWANGGETILTGHSGRVLRLTDVQHTRLVATIRGPETLVSQLLLSPDGQLVAVASRDPAIRLYDLGRREEVGVLTGRRPPSSMCFLADGSFLATVSMDNSVQLWDLASRRPGAALWGPAGEVFVGLALYAEWNHLAVAVADGRIRVWGPPG